MYTKYEETKAQYVKTKNIHVKYDQCDTRQLTLVRSLASSAKLTSIRDRISSRITAANLMLISFFFIVIANGCFI